MHKGYLAASLTALLLGVACFLAPGALSQLSQVLDRTVGVINETLLKRRAARYLLGLALFGLGLGLFRLAYLSPLFREAR
jgi:hypothetical protein